MKIVMMFSIMLMLSGAVIMDLRTGKIANSYNIFWMVYGVIYSFTMAGPRGLILSFIGIMLPIVGLMLLFASRVIGAGDIKLFATLGALMGLEVIRIVIYSFLLCGIFGGCLLIVRIIRVLARGGLSQGICKALVNNGSFTRVAFSIFILGGFVWYLLEGGIQLGV